jgi:hypothetical protein
MCHDIICINEHYDNVFTNFQPNFSSFEIALQTLKINIKMVKVKVVALICSFFNMFELSYRVCPVIEIRGFFVFSPWRQYKTT